MASRNKYKPIVLKIVQVKRKNDVTKCNNLNVKHKFITKGNIK